MMWLNLLKISFSGYRNRYGRRLASLSSNNLFTRTGQCICCRVTRLYPGLYYAVVSSRNALWRRVKHSWTEIAFPPLSRKTYFGRSQLINSSKGHSCVACRHFHAYLIISVRTKTRIFFSRSRAAKILTAGIPCVFWGLKFESEAEIGEKDVFRSGTN